MKELVLALTVLVLLIQTGCLTQSSPGRSSVPLFETEAHPVIRSYDESFTNKVQKKWNYFLDGVPSEHIKKSRLVLAFRLLEDGSVTNMKVLETTKSQLLDLLGERAVLDSQPFPPWLPAMREEIGKGFRDVTFSFIYQ